jgi:hypothetical protein
MKTVIFLGPTLAAADARRILDARYLPPVKHGDVISAIYNERPEVIGIIDGVIGDTLSVWHKEILDALNNGIMVYGAGAMGALRAAELDAFGMKGVGEVYRCVKSNQLEDDDEVMVQFEQQDGRYTKVSEPMVNIRAGFWCAAQQGVIDQAVLERLVTIAKSLFYPRRTYPLIFKKAVEQGVSEHTIGHLSAFLDEHVVDIQRQDAVELLQAIKGEQGSVEKKKGRRKSKSTGRLFSVLYNRDRRVQWDGVEVPLYAIGNYAALSHPGSEALKDSAFNRQLVLLLADLLHVKITGKELAEEVSRFRGKHGVTDEVDFSQWLGDNDLSRDEFNQLMRDSARVRRLHRWLLYKNFIEGNTKFILDELKLNNQYKEWKQKTASIEKILLEREEEVMGVVNQVDYGELLTGHLKAEHVSANLDLPDLAREMGFSRDEFILQLARVKVVRESLNALVARLFWGEEEEAGAGDGR